MPHFEVVCEDVGYTTDPEVSGSEFTPNDLIAINAELSGKLPAGVLKILGVSLSGDDEVDAGDPEAKIFATVKFLVDAPTEAAAQRFDPPAPFCKKIIGKLNSDFADSLEDSWEILEVSAIEPQPTRYRAARA